MEELLPASVDGIMFGGVYAMIALGIVLLYKSSKVLNLAYGEILMFLGYILATFMGSMHLHSAISLVLMLVISAILGLVLYRLINRPLLGQPFWVMMMVTLVMGLVFRGIVILVWGEPIALPPFIPTGGMRVGTIIIRYQYLISFIIALVLFLLLVLLFQRTRIGLGMRCVSEDQQISQSMGINVKRIFLISWVICCMIAAVCGALLGSIQTVTPNLSAVGISKALPVILLGGLESVPGALVGGIIVGLAESFSAAYVGEEFMHIVPFTLMLLILLFRPYGLFGLREIERI